MAFKATESHANLPVERVFEQPANLRCFALRALCVRAQGVWGARTGLRFARDMHGLWVKGIKLTK